MSLVNQTSVPLTIILNVNSKGKLSLKPSQTSKTKSSGSEYNQPLVVFYPWCLRRFVVYFLCPHESCQSWRLGLLLLALSTKSSLVGPVWKINYVCDCWQIGNYYAYIIIICNNWAIQTGPLHSCVVFRPYKMIDWIARFFYMFIEQIFVPFWLLHI